MFRADGESRLADALQQIAQLRGEMKTAIGDIRALHARVEKSSSDIASLQSGVSIAALYGNARPSKSIQMRRDAAGQLTADVYLSSEGQDGLQ